MDSGNKFIVFFTNFKNRDGIDLRQCSVDEIDNNKNYEFYVYHVEFLLVHDEVSALKVSAFIENIYRTYGLQGIPYIQFRDKDKVYEGFRWSTYQDLKTPEEIRERYKQEKQALLTMLKEIES